MEIFRANLIDRDLLTVKNQHPQVSMASTEMPSCNTDHKDQERSAYQRLAAIKNRVVCCNENGPNNHSEMKMGHV